MIQIFRSAQGELLRVKERVPGCWMHVHDPSPGEVAELVDDLGVPEDFITAALDLDEIPRTERDDGYTFILIQIPYYRGKEDPVPYNTVPLGIIIGEGVLLTICTVETEIIREIIIGSWRGFSTGKQKRFILRLFLKTATRYLQYLRIINKSVEVVEDRLEAEQQNEDVLALLKYEKSLTYFMTALRANEIVMERLERSGMFEEFPEDEELLVDALTEMRQAIEMTAIASDILHQTMNAFSSIISNNLNVVMKFLAAITVILTFPTMIFSFYGMNVPLPLANRPYFSFLFATALSLSMALIALYIFIRKRYL